MAVDTTTLELYHQLRQFSPRLSIQAFTCTLARLTGDHYSMTWRRQFADTFDIYLAILRKVNRRVASHLGRNTPAWRQKHSCPCCFYKARSLSCPFGYC